MLDRFKSIYRVIFPVLISLAFSTDSLAQEMLYSNARIALNELKRTQKKNGSWDAFFSFDTTKPIKHRNELNSWNNLIIVDLLKPLSHDYEFDSLLIKPLILVRDIFYDQNTGLVNFGTRIKEYPKDSDDTALFWLIDENEDTTAIANALDTLLKYRNKEGFYHIWLRENGCLNLRACGDDPNPVDLLSNIHVYLFLKTYAPVYAEELCKVFRKEEDKLEDLWVYNSKCPWLYYIRQIDLAGKGCSMNWDVYDNKVRPVSGQELYTEMAKLIRDLNLGGDEEETEKRALALLTLLSDNDFGLINNNPLMMFHNDQTLKKPAYFWSYELPYVLWLRLYHEYGQNK